VALLLDEFGGPRLFEAAAVPRAGVAEPVDDVLARLGPRQADHLVPRYHGEDGVVVTAGDAPVLVERPHRLPGRLRDLLSELLGGEQSEDARVRFRHPLVALESAERGLLERPPLARRFAAERLLVARAARKDGDDVDVSPLDFDPRRPLEATVGVVETGRGAAVRTRVVEVRHVRA